MEDLEPKPPDIINRGGGVLSYRRRAGATNRPTRATPSGLSNFIDRALTTDRPRTHRTCTVVHYFNATSPPAPKIDRQAPLTQAVAVSCRSLLSQTRSIKSKSEQPIPNLRNWRPIESQAERFVFALQALDVVGNRRRGVEATELPWGAITAQPQSERQRRDRQRDGPR